MKKLPLLLFSLCILSLASPVFAGLSLPNPLGGTDTFEKLIENITNYIFNIVGILATLMFVIAGIFYLTSAGNPGRIETAKKAAIYAAVGAAIALAGQGLVALIRKIITG
ncbi:MAG: TrbC/VirB2 family protein [Patescibacteria group bacterium]